MKKIIFGPPGTGKTTTLLNIIEKRLIAGHYPRQIAFIAFTRKAANEARTRALARFKLAEDDMPWYRTLHSASFRMLGLNRSQVMTTADYIAICKHLGLYITINRSDEDGTTSSLTKGDRLFFTENMARIRGQSLEETWQALPDEDLDWLELSRLRLTLEQYKSRYGKLDFTDMIERVVTEKLIMPVSLAVVDEAQDLSPLQWSAVDTLFSDADELYISGDDDQAIFRWAGADPRRLLNDVAERQVLPQSYRVPRKIQAIAQTIISGVQSRVQKQWSPTADEGDVVHCNSLEQIDMRTGTWLLLGRNVSHLRRYVDHCLVSGYVFDSQIDCPLKGDSLKGIVSWEKLRKGESVPVGEVLKVYDLISAGSITAGIEYGKKGWLEKRCKPDEPMTLKRLKDEFGLRTDKIWHVALDRIPATEKQYFLNALRQGEKLLREPRIKITTIHGAKGGEADNVVICPDMANRTWAEFEKNPQDEHRVWYVAVTRTKKVLYILEPITNKSFPF